MIDDRMRVGVLRTIEHVKTVNERLAALSCEFKVNVMTREGGTEVDTGCVVITPAAKFYLRSADIKCASRIFLDSKMGQACIVLDNDLHNSVSKSNARRGVCFNQRRLTSCFGDDDHVWKNDLAPDCS